jgi:hypothetical protein
MAGNSEQAVAYMKRGYSDLESVLTDWNAFVDANIAFLPEDKDGLVAMRDRIAKQPVMPDRPNIPDWAVGKKMNLDVVEGFLACFGQAYHIAYEPPCRPAQ